MHNWFAHLQNRADLMSNVEANLHLLVREQTKSIRNIQGGLMTVTTFNLRTTSST